MSFLIIFEGKGVYEIYRAWTRGDDWNILALLFRKSHVARPQVLLPKEGNIFCI